MLKSRIICIDIETTGLDWVKDEILQIAIINGTGKVLYNSYIRPERIKEWKEAKKINKISWKAVRKAPVLRHEKRKIERILKKAGLIIGYNHKYFDLPFLAAQGINTAVKAKLFDVMLEFAPIAGEYDTEHQNYKWKPLTYCAEYYGYTNYKPHDALEDVRATLYCYYAIQKGQCSISRRKEEQRLRTDKHKLY